MREDVSKKWIDYFTVAGLVTFVILAIIYLNLETISQIHIDFSMDSALPGIEIPWLANLNLDWFYAMDPVSRMIFGFLMLMLGGSLVGGLWMVAIRKRASARK